MPNTSRSTRRTSAPIPPGVTPDEAGALGADGITALRGLDDELRLRPGQTLMIFGASGGIGHIAVQLAKRMGARVLAIASGADGVELVRRLGADAAIDGRTTTRPRRRARSRPDGLDAALVLVDGKGLAAALRAVKQGGRVAYPNGVEPEPRVPDGIESHAYDGTPARSVRPAEPPHRIGAVPHRARARVPAGGCRGGAPRGSRSTTWEAGVSGTWRRRARTRLKSSARTALPQGGAKINGRVAQILPPAAIGISQSAPRWGWCGTGGATSMPGSAAGAGGPVDGRASLTEARRGADRNRHRRRTQSHRRRLDGQW